MDIIACLAVTITRLVDASFPGFVECLLLDAAGHEHRFVEKVPVLIESAEGLDDIYPRPGCIRCVVMGHATDEYGHPLVEVSTAVPDGVESQAEENRFLVHARQVMIGTKPLH